LITLLPNFLYDLVLDTLLVLQPLHHLEDVISLMLVHGLALDLLQLPEVLAQIDIGHELIVDCLDLLLVELHHFQPLAKLIGLLFVGYVVAEPLLWVALVLVLGTKHLKVVKKPLLQDWRLLDVVRREMIYVDNLEDLQEVIRDLAEQVEGQLNTDLAQLARRRHDVVPLRLRVRQRVLQLVDDRQIDRTLQAQKLEVLLIAEVPGLLEALTAQLQLVDLLKQVQNPLFFVLKDLVDLL